MLAVPGCGASDCAECSRFGVPQVCPRGHHSGIGQDGFYAPYGTIDIRGAVHVPEGKSKASYLSLLQRNGQRCVSPVVHSE